MNKIALSLSLSLLALGLAVAPTDAQKKKSKKRTRTTAVVNYVSLSGDELRKSIEKRMLRGEYQHDGSGELMYIGTIESVPALLKVLKDHPPYVEQIEPLPPPAPGRPPNPPQSKPRKSYICTYGHALGALWKITGQNFTEYEEWSKWWEEYSRKRIPSSK